MKGEKRVTTEFRAEEVEAWLDASECVEPLTDADIPRLVHLLSKETDVDSYAVSAAYYVFTGRRGAWLYHYGDTYVPICWHPNVEGQILVFPPRGDKDYAAITALLNEAQSPPRGFLLARFKPREITRLKTVEAFLSGTGFSQVDEEVLDWRFPVRILSTLNTARMRGGKFMLIRNRVRQIDKYSVEVSTLTVDYVTGIEAMVARWAATQSESEAEMKQRIDPYRQALRLLAHAPLGLDGRREPAFPRRFGHHE